MDLKKLFIEHECNVINKTINICIHQKCKYCECVEDLPINTEDPITLEDINDIPENMKFVLKHENKKVVFHAYHLLKWFLVNPTHPLFRTNVSFDEIQKCITVVKKNIDNFDEEFPLFKKKIIIDKAYFYIINNQLRWNIHFVLNPYYEVIDYIVHIKGIQEGKIIFYLEYQIINKLDCDIIEQGDTEYYIYNP
jgi:hypothetical protein